MLLSEVIPDLCNRDFLIQKQSFLDLCEQTFPVSQYELPEIGCSVRRTASPRLLIIAVEKVNF